MIPLVKSFSAPKSNMNFINTLINQLVNGLQDKRVIFSGLGLPQNIKIKIKCLHFVLPFNVEIGFIKIKFKINLLPTDFTVGLRVAVTFD
jgi:hypothetical protein